MTLKIGGDANLSYATSLPNIIRQYSPNLHGYSTGTTPTTGYLGLPNTQLNVAMSGGHATDMLEQARELVRKIRESMVKLISVATGRWSPS